MALQWLHHDAEIVQGMVSPPTLGLAPEQVHPVSSGGGHHGKYHVWSYCCVSQCAWWEGRLLRHSCHYAHIV